MNSLKFLGKPAPRKPYINEVKDIFDPRGKRAEHFEEAIKEAAYYLENEKLPESWLEKNMTPLIKEFTGKHYNELVKLKKHERSERFVAFLLRKTIGEKHV